MKNLTALLFISFATTAWTQTAVNITGGSVGGSVKKMTAPLHLFLEDGDSQVEYTDSSLSEMDVRFTSNEMEIPQRFLVKGEDSWSQYIYSSLSPAWRERLLKEKASITWMAPDELEHYGYKETADAGLAFFLLHSTDDDKTAVMAFSRGLE